MEGIAKVEKQNILVVGDMQMHTEREREREIQAYLNDFITFLRKNRNFKCEIFYFIIIKEVLIQ